MFTHADEILYSPYSLIPRSSLNSKTGAHARQGVLLCINGGFSAIHPWPELGDASIDDQLELLKSRKPTKLGLRARHYASIDRAARSEKRSLFDGLSIPKSHHLIAQATNLSLIEGNSATVKIKVGRDVEEEARAINTHARPGFTLRLDANSAWDYEGALAFWNTLTPAVQSQIEFIEDAIPYNEAAWMRLSDAGIPLALDNYGDERVGNGYVARIIKPLVQDCEKLAGLETSGKKLIVTSAMDHPLGQIIAAWEAARLAPRKDLQLLTCGLLSHTMYEPNIFSEALRSRDGSLLPPAGTGFGFDDLLKAIEWKKLI